MSAPSFFDNVREWIGGMAFRLFLWSIRLTSDQYFELLGRDYVAREKMKVAQ